MTGEPASRLRRPLLVELVGPPGAGKSTVFQRLLGRHPAIEPMPVLRRRPYTAILARNVLSVVATLVRRGALNRRWTCRQVLMMAYLQALPRVFDGRDGIDGRIVVFDQGPIYFLSRPSLRDERLVGWLERTFSTWGSRLDAVVWLDAPDAILIERINARTKFHRLKGGPDDAALDAIAESRSFYERALAALEERRSGPAILRFDTSRQSADEIAREIFAAVAGDGPAPESYAAGEFDRRDAAFHGSGGHPVR